MFKLRTLIVLGMLFSAFSAQSAPPVWSVNPASFQFSMTVTAVANINCTELQNPSVMVAAFVGTNLRGVANTSNIINGRFIASMVVYSNLAQGENVSLKIYNPANDSIYDATGTILFQDNASYGVTTSPFVIRNNNNPTEIALSNNNVPEGQVMNTVVGTLSSTDPDPLETFTYQLVSGTGSVDNANFNILGNTLRTSTILSNVQKPTHQIRIRTTDAGGCSFEQFFTINVTSVNTAPTQILLSDSAINENLAANSVIGTLSAIDPNVGEVFTYSLVPGTGAIDNASFNILGNQLRTSQSFNFEIKSNYSIRVRVTDSGNNTFERAISVTVNDINDVPTNILLGGNNVGASFAENRPVGSHIAELSTIDEDPTDVHSYSFVNVQGNDNGLFVIVGNSLRTNAAFDFETRQNYVVFVQTNDGRGGVFSKQFSLTVADSNDTPSDISLSNLSVEENRPQGTFIGKLTSVDPDVSNNSFSYTFVAGQGSGGNSQFTISNDSLYTNAIFDFEATASYSVRINTNDGNGGNFQKSFSISVINTNDAPTDINITSNQIPENRPANTVIGQLLTIDQDANNTFVYTLVPGTGSVDNNSFNISGNQIRTSVPFDFETKNSYSIRLRATDNAGGFFEKQFLIEVTNEIDAPTLILISDSTIYENRPLNTLIGNLSSVNQDNVTHSYTFSNVPGNDNDRFLISGNQLRSNFAFDFEARSVYAVYITSTAAPGAAVTQLIQISVRDTNDMPTDIALSGNSITENRPAGSFIGRLSTTDPDTWDSHSYQLVSGTGATGNSSFTISNDSLYAASMLNFELQNTFSIRVQTTDLGGLTFAKVFTLTVNDSNDAPTGITLSTSSVRENQPVGTVVGVLNSVDADANQTHTYSLVSGTGSVNNALFSIVGNQLRTNAIYNFEQINTYQIRIQTNDGNGGIYSDAFVITVLDDNDAPSNILLSNATVKENSIFGTTIGSFTTIDQDTADTHGYTLANVSGNDNGSFFIFNNELRTNAAFNFETRRIFNVFVQSSDGKSSIIRQFIINILDSNDAPVNLSLTNNTIAENLPTLTFISEIFTQEEDVVDAHSYSLVGGVGADDNSMFTIAGDSLLTNMIFNFEQRSSYSIRIRTTDLGGLSFERQVAINILNANDTPTDILLSSNEVTENRLSRSIVGTFTTVDQDVANTFNYSLVNGTGSTDNSLFVIQGNELRTNRVFNFEEQQQYSIRVQTNDGNGGTIEKAFTIIIIDSNDAPSNIILATNNVAENATIGRLVTTISTVDQDVNDQHAYEFVNISGNNNDKFLIVGNELRTAEVFNFEVKNFYIIYLRSTDPTGTNIVRQFLINIVDSVDAPSNIEVSNFTISENLPLSSIVGTITSVDEDQFTGFTYTLVTGVGSIDNVNFVISNDSLLSNTVFDFETKSNYTIRLRSTDATNAFFEKQFNIQVVDANDAPTALTMTNQSIRENELVGSLVGEFVTADVDAGDLHVYRFVSGAGDADNNMFIIEDNKLRARISANFEAKSSYSIRVSTTDLGGASIESSFIISIIDVVEKPTILDQVFSFKEDAKPGDLIGRLVAISPDAGANLKFYFIDNDNKPFQINPNTGEITLINSVEYRKTRAFNYQVYVMDEQITPVFDTATITINVLEVIKPNLPLPVTNYLSPNGDGINDFFEIENIQLYTDYSLVVYNEMGMEVYRVANNYQNNWDGTFNGKQLSNGVYFYVFYNSATNDEFKGSINIFR